MIDFLSKAIVQFRADTGDLEQGLKRLTGEEKKLQQAQLDAAKDRNKGFDEWVGRLGNVNQALELSSKAIGFAKDAFKAYSEDLRLRAAAGSVSIEKLKEASLGLRTEHELLTFAAQTQNAAFKLNEQQMATAQKAMVALTRAGFDQEEVTKKVTEAIVKANGGGLDDFGILVKSGSTDLEKFNNLMDALTAKASGVDTGMRSAGEAMQASSVSMHESFDKIKRSLGELVAAMAPLLEALASAVGIVADIATGVLVGHSDGVVTDMFKKIKEQTGAQSMFDYAGGQIRSAAGPQLVGSRDRWDDGGATGIDDGKLQGALTGVYEFGKKYDSRYNSKPGKADPEIAEAARERARIIVEEYEEANRVAMERMAQDNMNNAVGGIGSLSMLGIPSLDSLDAAMAEVTSETDRLFAEFNAKQYAKYREAKQATFLESAFGKLEDFNAYAAAFDMLGAAVTTGFNAWVDGADSMKDAIKRTIADSLKTLGAQMAIESLKHGAYALGSLAFGDLSGAATHGIAAGKFALVAAAAGVAAKSIGTSAGVANEERRASEKAKEEEKAQKERAGRSGSSSGSDKPGKDTYVVVYTDAFSEGSPSYKQEIAQRAVRKAMGGTGWSED